MSVLLKDSPEPTSMVTRIGGLPTGPADFQWPVCQCCSGKMQFLAQVALAETGITSLADRDQLLLLFECQNDPGMCDDWDADGGGNAACLVPAANAVEIPAPDGPTSLPAVSHCQGAEFVDSDADSYLAMLESQDGLGVVGKLGGQPAWIQGEETPDCQCGSSMRFVAQLEESGGGGINFGDAGTGYAFVCESCNDQAKFLWQCS